ncbi:hypothetical protein ZWY2020_029485 [Hordeum vulgare]|nr:hypothetical protein ZWY2020_029485 [Hordeum vulgare]
MGHRRAAGDAGGWRKGGREHGTQRNYGYSRSNGRTGSGSDSLSWRKDGFRASGDGPENTEKGEEVTSPVKNTQGRVQSGVPKKLLLGENVKEKDGNDGEELVAGGKGVREDGHSREEQDLLTKQAELTGIPQAQQDTQRTGDGNKSKTNDNKKFRRRDRMEHVSGPNPQRESILGQKRTQTATEGAEEKDAKKGRLVVVMERGVDQADMESEQNNLDCLSAGLQEQPRRTQ